MVPAQHDLTIYRDRDFSQVFTFKSHGAAMVLTGYSAKAQIRPTPDSDTLIVDFTTAISGVAGTVTISLTAAQALALVDDLAFWDLVLTDTLALRQTYLEGQVQVKGTVTRVGGGVGVG